MTQQCPLHHLCGTELCSCPPGWDTPSSAAGLIQGCHHHLQTGGHTWRGLLSQRREHVGKSAWIQKDPWGTEERSSMDPEGSKARFNINPEGSLVNQGQSKIGLEASKPRSRRIFDEPGKGPTWIQKHPSSVQNDPWCTKPCPGWIQKDPSSGPVWIQKDSSPAQVQKDPSPGPRWIQKDPW